MSNELPSQFINEPIDAIAAPTAGGLTSAPDEFKWRGHGYKIKRVTDSRKGFGRDRSHNSSERYLDRQWFSCKLDNGQTARIYFDRRNPKQRWWIYSLEN